MSNYFYCYSIRLKDFLKLQGLQFAVRGKHPNGNYFWKVKKCSLLDEKLDLWNKYKEEFPQTSDKIL